MGKRQLQAITTLGAVVLSVLLGAHGASAGCHSFSAQVSASTVEEGGRVSVIVSRDNSRADSNVRVSTLDGTAKAGSDFSALDEQVNFTGSETQRSFDIQIIDDQDSEASETFTVHLSNPGGCAVNPNFSLTSDRTVTINPSDAAAPTATPATVEPTPTPTRGPSTPLETPDSDEDGGGLSPVAIAAIVLVVLLVAAAGIVAYRRRR